MSFEFINRKRETDRRRDERDRGITKSVNICGQRWFLRTVTGLLTTLSGWHGIVGVGQQRTQAIRSCEIGAFHSR